ncbi:MAG: PH domain-containing protein [Bacteroidaceae bacterium]|nr:PH domain-containing protein [Bacteroidaceae bacterium]
MQRTFKSKVGWWYYAALAYLIACLILAIWQKNGIAIVAMFIANMTLIQLMLKTEYVVADGVLYIKCWIMPVKKISVTKIKTIKETHNPLSSYALSLDRLKIEYEKTFTLVSPDNKQDFVNELRKYNPDIIYITRKQNS